MTRFDLLQTTKKGEWNEWKIRESDNGISVSVATGFGTGGGIEEEDCEIKVCCE